MGQPQTVLFCGSRNWSDIDMIRSDIAGLSDGSLVVHGGAKGADRMAGTYARLRGLHVAQVDALWDFYGKKAGPLRNQAMLRLHIDFAFCYPLDGPGTADMMRRLAYQNIPHVIREPAAAFSRNEAP